MFLKIINMLLDKQDEVIYYDPCESPEELMVMDGVMGLQEGKQLEVGVLSRQCQQLESKRGSICARRARLRNRKVGAPGRPSCLIKNSPYQCRRHRRPRFYPWVRKIPWRREWLATHSSILAWRNPWTEESGGL